MKPNLFIVGAPKCGTTAWVEYLGEHPRIAFSRVKEPHYFALDLPGIRFVKTEAEYEALFDQAGSATIVGEASVMSLFSKVAAEQIRRYNPDARILIFLRRQQDYLPSLHQQFLYTFQDCIDDFEQAWRLSGQRTWADIPETCKEPKLLDYKAMGRFDEQVGRFLANFPPAQVRVLRFEEWVRQPRETYLDILSFLGLEDDGRSDFRRINEAKQHRWERLARILNYPPRWLLPPVNAIKAAMGKDTLGIAEAITSLNRKRGYRHPIAPSLKAEIEAFYREDNRRLDRRLSSGELVA